MKQMPELPVTPTPKVAPLAGAWIETHCPRSKPQELNTSPPSRGRGLKRSFAARVELLQHVAPLAGAWIETDY